MLKRFFSTRGRYRLYAIGVAVGLAIYLIGGFVLSKALWSETPFTPSLYELAGLFGCTALFAAIHISSMRDLDKPVPPRPQKSHK